MSRDYVLQPFRPPVQLQIDYARELNPQQHAAVTAVPGAALVIAGAGSGKTRTLTYRVAFLIEQGIPAERILLLTFTNKAAREMMRRVADLIGGDLAGLWGGTFHSIGARVLRRHADRIGYRRDFTIMDREDARGLIKACMAEAEIDPKASRFPKADLLADLFSMTANTERSLSEWVMLEHSQFATLLPKIEEVGRRYAERKRAANVMDFDDLIVQWLKLLREDPETLELYQRRFQFILVDEYQDTNRLQADLIDLLASRHLNVMVVGDDSQSIYSWRGANFRNILEFPKRYPGAAVHKIELNYRSTPEILSLANAAIAPNLHQFAKELTSARESGSQPVRVACSDAQQQASFVAQRILELREEGINLDRMAVLYRSHFHALELQLELTRRNIPFMISSGIRFFEQAHIKDVTAYLRLTINPSDELSFKRLAEMLPGIGAKAAERLWTQFALQDRSPLGTPGTGSPSPIATALQKCSASVPKKAVSSWAQLVITISQLEAEPLRTRPGGMIRHVLEAGYADYLKDNFVNHSLRLEDLEQLATFALQFSTTEEFLTQLSLLTNLESEENAPVTGDDERVRLSTVHQAKGLEFDVVFVIMLCEGMFPSGRSLATAEGEEEERRLFYVAVTRARNELYLSYPLIRSGYGYGSGALLHPSRFLTSISSDLVEEWNLRPYPSPDF